MLDIAAKAVAIEIDDRALLDETLRWFRFSAREIPVNDQLDPGKQARQEG